MSGTLTPLAHSTNSPQEPASIPPTRMPGFHHRKEVQLMLRKWRNSFSLWGRIWAGQSVSSRDQTQRFVLPQHTFYIK